MNEAVSKFRFIGESLRTEYERTTGFSLSDDFLSKVYYRCRMKYPLISTNELEDRIRMRFRNLIDKWNGYNLLSHLKTYGFVLIDGDEISLNQNLIAKYQHYKGEILEFNEVGLKSIIDAAKEAKDLSDTVVLSPNDKKNIIEHYYELLLNRFS